MTTKQLEKRIAQLELEVAELKKQQSVQPSEPKKGWRAWVGAFSNDPFMKDAFALAQEYRERDRQKAKRKNTPKKAKR